MTEPKNDEANRRNYAKQSRSLNTIFTSLSLDLFFRINIYYLLWCNALHSFKQFYQWNITGTTDELFYPCTLKNITYFYMKVIRIIWDDNGQHCIISLDFPMK
eukprot:250678_1